MTVRLNVATNPVLNDVKFLKKYPQFSYKYGGYFENYTELKREYLSRQTSHGNLYKAS